MAEKQTKKRASGAKSTGKSSGGRKSTSKSSRAKAKKPEPIRREVGARMKIRYTPLLHFVMDDSIAYGVRMTHRIDEVVSSQGGGKEA